MCGLELWCGLGTWRGEPCLAMACMSISGRTGSPGKADSARMAASICARFTVEGGTCTLAAGGGTEAGGGFCTAPAAGFNHHTATLRHAWRSPIRVHSTVEGGMCTHAGISNAAGSTSRQCRQQWSTSHYVRLCGTCEGLASVRESYMKAG